MNIFFYCQYVWGMGHLMRSLEFARALSNHEVTLIAGGQEVEVDLPSHVQLVRLPALSMNEKFTKLIAGEPGQSVKQILKKRKQILYSLFKEEKPDLLIIELYPFGRTIFGAELEPVLQDIRDGKMGPVKTVCSLRDILVEKKDPAAYERRVLEKLGLYFDALLIHSDQAVMRIDETFSRVEDIQIPVVYTGFVTQQHDSAAGRILRQELVISSEQKLIVASAGGGRSGFKLLSSVIEAYGLLRGRQQILLEVFAGPFMEDEEFEKLSSRAEPGVRVRRYTKRLLDYLSAADLSVSLAGYNTCMNLLVTKVPALVYPYSRQQEQPMRAARIKKFLPIKILNEVDIQPSHLCKCIEQMLHRKETTNFFPINLNGAENAARFLNRWVRESII